MLTDESAKSQRDDRVAKQVGLEEGGEDQLDEFWRFVAPVELVAHVQDEGLHFEANVDFVEDGRNGGFLHILNTVSLVGQFDGLAGVESRLLLDVHVVRCDQILHI